MTEKVDDIRLAALERIAVDLWSEGDAVRHGILDLCYDLRLRRGLPLTQGVYPEDMTGAVVEGE